MPIMELTEDRIAEYLQIYLDRFANRTDVFAVQFWNEKKYWYQPIMEAVTLELIADLILGNVTVGWYCLSTESTCKWLCIDSDTDDGKLFLLNDLFKRHGWRTVLEGGRSGRDGHCWLFFDIPVPAVHLRRLANEFLRAAGIAEDHFEVFPKQTILKGPEKLGNAVRGPLGVHHKPKAGGVRGLFTEAGDSWTEQLEFLLNHKPNSAASLTRFIDELELRESAHKKSTPSKTSQRKTVFKSNGKTNSNGRPKSFIDWLDYAREHAFVSDGSFLRGPCPSCRATGHDQDGTHLSVGDRGGLKCWRGCTFEEILSAVKAQ